MKRLMMVCLAAVSLATSATAQDKAQQPANAPAQGGMQGGMPDMTKMGPAARKPTNEKQTKKEVSDFFKQQEELMKKGSFDDMLAAIDFPIYMATDTLKGEPMAKLYTREEYTAEMKPFHDKMPKDMQVKHNPTFVVLSDSLVSVTDDFTMTAGKQKVTGRSAGLLVKTGGQWKWKEMTEAGWGDMAQQHQQGTGGSPKPTERMK